MTRSHMNSLQAVEVAAVDADGPVCCKQGSPKRVVALKVCMVRC